MCDTGNLIDLSVEEETNALNKEKTEENANFLPSISATDEDFQVNQPHALCFIDAPLIGRGSLDNNPFDRIQKLANRQDDPFEIVEKEACFKARQSIQPNCEVKLANLLSLSDENLLDIDDNKYNKTNDLATAGATENANFLDNANNSPLISLGAQDNCGTPDSMYSAISGGSSDGSTSAGVKNKKLTEYRKKLLKLSLSNSTFNSPVCRRLCSDSQQMQQDTDTNFSPISAMFAEAAQCGEHMLAAESPLKFVDDDLMAEEPPNLIESERNFEADLEMLKIPMLEELPSPPSSATSRTCDEVINKNLSLEDFSTNIKPSVHDTVNAGLSTLEAIRAKLQAKKLENNNNNDISELLHGLKSLICDINAVDALKKQQANNLLETLSKALTAKDCDARKGTTELVPPPPPAIVRQGTFDLEIQGNAQTQHACSNNAVHTESEMMTAVATSGPYISDLPDCMFKSSATYDGETTDEKREYILPEVDPISPTQATRPVTPVEADVNDLVEQLTKLLQQQQFGQHSQDKNTNGSAASTINPTFIVVMNSSTVGQLPNMKKRNSFIASALENSLSDGSPDLKNSSNMQRRRSQSLSIHDKVKIVKFPINAVPQEEEQNDAPVAQKLPVIDVADFKTPARFLPRRNSFSSGTPYTSSLSASARRAADAAARAAPQQRRLSVVEAPNEKQRQHQAVVRPLPPMPSKRKVGQHTESIMKSSGPMKATIPFKKITPQLKTSPPTPEMSTSTLGDTATGNRHALNTSMQMFVKNSRIALTSTPMPFSRSSSTVGVTRTPIFPNADVIPTVQVTPMKRSNSLYPDAKGTLPKSRYSLSTTPGTKPVAAPSAAAAGLKRRTLTELKAKSPIKGRVSQIGTSIGARGAPPTKNTTSRLTTKSTQARMSTATNRSSVRLSNSRSSTSSTLRNKENKQP